ncbi:F-box protein PP2-A13-like isoform X2 [Phragmites australis]|uniref:F-box protein PP2-A13-like isoform X2 n=1 Tax=Phragmites australis TaxID=29695 RepID=UPI002D782E7D|nr:F-box protein PP2-A13-like isoform X2 [Phragmites australis]
MGAAPSSVMGPEGYGRERGQTSLGDMPEGCVAAVLLYLDPPEICHVARLNRAFRGAASADCVWTAKFPANYRYLAALAAAADDDCGCDDPTEGNVRCCSSATIKKEIYARLCRPTHFDGRTKEFWIEKNKGGLCMSISSKAMSITGIDDRRYWSHLSTEESRYFLLVFVKIS